MSVFDAQTFAQMTFTDANSTESTPIPVGEWVFQIEKAEVKTWQKREDPSVAGLKLLLTLSNEDPAITAITGRKTNKLIYELMLDLTDAGGLDFGKGMNIRLGRLREAVGLNKPGQPFSFDMLIGRAVKASVKHEIWKETLQARCDSVAAA